MIYIFKFFNFFYLVLRKSHKEVLRAQYLQTYNIDRSVQFWETTTITGDGDIDIGAGTYIGKNSFISSQSGYSVSIGSDCKISHNVHIRTSSYKIDTLMDALPLAHGGDITIGSNVWIGLNVYIKGGVTIGDGVTIGANSVVTKDVPSLAVVAGNPAAIIRRARS